MLWATLEMLKTRQQQHRAHWDRVLMADSILAAVWLFYLRFRNIELSWMCVTSGTATRTLWCSQALREEIMSNLPLQDLRPSSNITATVCDTPSVIVSANNNNKSQPCYLVFLSVQEPRCTPVLQLLFSILDSVVWLWTVLDADWSAVQ